MSPQKSLTDLTSKNQLCNFAACLVGGWCTAQHASKQGSSEGGQSMGYTADINPVMCPGGLYLYLSVQAAG